MSLPEYVTRRNQYRYPRVGLGGSLERWEELSFPSTHLLDCHHNQLLLSDRDDQIVLGYLSTIFWGHYVGKGNLPNPRRAEARVRRSLYGESRKGCVQSKGVRPIAYQIRATFANITSDRYAEALELLCGLPQLWPTFASKVCAFLAPEKCGVVDRVTASKYPCFGFSVDGGGYVTGGLSNRANYARYCCFLQKQAETLNSHGQQFQWRDDDGVCYPWRAVDVERALYCNL